MAKPKNKDEYRAELAETFAMFWRNMDCNGARNGAAPVAMLLITVSQKLIIEVAMPSGYP